jgi:hypothetical protein
MMEILISETLAERLGTVEISVPLNVDKANSRTAASMAYSEIPVYSGGIGIKQGKSLICHDRLCLALTP